MQTAVRMQTRSVRASRATVRPQASLQKIAQVAGVAVSSLALSFAAHAGERPRIRGQRGEGGAARAWRAG